MRVRVRALRPQALENIDAKSVASAMARVIRKFVRSMAH